jgi:hypothetical protein
MMTSLGLTNSKTKQVDLVSFYVLTASFMETLVFTEISLRGFLN